jgi:hypothetical protein
MTPPEEESDQLPESKPSPAGGSQDTPDATRDEAEESAGASDAGDDEGEGGENQATGNPANAG